MEAEVEALGFNVDWASRSVLHPQSSQGPHHRRTRPIAVRGQETVENSRIRQGVRPNTSEWRSAHAEEVRHLRQGAPARERLRRPRTTRAWGLRRPCRSFIRTRISRLGRSGPGCARETIPAGKGWQIKRIQQASTGGLPTRKTGSTAAGKGALCSLFDIDERCEFRKTGTALRVPGYDGACSWRLETWRLESKRLGRRSVTGVLGGGRKKRDHGGESPWEWLARGPGAGSLGINLRVSRLMVAGPRVRPLHPQPARTRRAAGGTESGS